MIPVTEIHPMLVHFPIVLWICAEAIAVIILISGGDLSARNHWPLTAFYALLAGTASGILAAFFGDTAKDHAIAAGFPAHPIVIHEIFAITTIVVFGLHLVSRLLSIWRRYTLTGKRGWIAEIPGLIGIVLLITTAYFGGELVYRLGVNVAVVH